MKVAVIGAGLFGSIIGRCLANAGAVVHWYDARRPNAGSKPAACLMKPSWLGSMTTQAIDDGLALLQSQYGEVRRITFDLGVPVPERMRGVFWVDPRKILSETVTRATVKGVTQSGQGHILEFDDGTPSPQYDRVVVATGIWANELFPAAQVKGQMGAAFLWNTGGTIEPKIRVWAPYKQIVAFNRGDGIWCGDGSAIIPENWTLERQLKSRERCAEFVGLAGTASTLLLGIRPYVKLEKKVPCLVDQVRPGLWLATGGAKNGTMAAAWAAERIRDQL